MKRALLYWVIVVSLLSSSIQKAQAGILFSDTFDTDTTANYIKKDLQNPYSPPMVLSYAAPEQAIRFSGNEGGFWYYNQLSGVYNGTVSATVKFEKFGTLDGNGNGLGATVGLRVDPDGSWAQWGIWGGLYTSFGTQCAVIGDGYSDGANVVRIPYSYNEGQTYDLKLEVSGSHATLYINGSKVIERDGITQPLSGLGVTAVQVSDGASWSAPSSFLIDNWQVTSPSGQTIIYHSNFPTIQKIWTDTFQYAPPSDGKFILTIDNPDGLFDGSISILDGTEWNNGENLVFCPFIIQGVQHGTFEMDVKQIWGLRPWLWIFDNYNTSNSGYDAVTLQFESESVSEQPKTYLGTLTSGSMQSNSAEWPFDLASPGKLLFNVTQWGGGGGSHSVYIDNVKIMELRVGWGIPGDTDPQWGRGATAPDWSSIEVPVGHHTVRLAHEDDSWGDNYGTRETKVYFSDTTPPTGQATGPNPANEATNVSLTTYLSWTPGSGAATHNVYFGTFNPPPFIHIQAGTTYDPGTMNPNTTYYWRIDEKNAGGTTTGVVWNFTTEMQFVWQRIVLEGQTYTVKVKADQMPNDPSTFVYPVYCGDCDKRLESKAITVFDSGNNIVNDDDTKRKVLAYARNAALYRSWSNKVADPVSILEKVGGFQKIETSPSTIYCGGFVPYPCFELGGTDTSFGYSYPGHLYFPNEYLDVKGAARLVDWYADNFFVNILGGYTHPLGIKYYEQRKQMYIELLHKMILQDGVIEISNEYSQGLVEFLRQTSDILLNEDDIQAIALAKKLASIVEAIRGYADIATGISKVLPTLELTKTDIDWMAKILNAQANYTDLAEKVAPKVLAAIDIVIKPLEMAARVKGDFFAAVTYAMQLQDHGCQILEALQGQVFCASCGPMDSALYDAFELVRAEFSEDIRQDFWQLVQDDLKKRSSEHAGDYALDSVQLYLSTVTVISAVGVISAPVGGLAGSINLAIAMGRFAGGFINDKLEHETLQQAVVACTTLEYAWWQRPLKNHALMPLQVNGAIQSNDIDQINWLISTKLFEGTFVTANLINQNSGLINDIRDFLGDTALKKRRLELNSWRDRLVNIFFGRSDKDVNLCRLAGRPTAEGQYIGFVPTRELDFLVAHTKPGSALLDHYLKYLLHSPGEIGVIDPAGRHLGTFVHDAGGGNFVSDDIAQIPGGTYSGSGSDPREIIIPEPSSGTFEIHLFGKGKGPYTLEIQRLSGDIVLSTASVTGTFEPNRAEDGIVNVNTSEGFDVEIASAPQPRGTIIGRVIDADTGNPIDGVRIRASDTSEITGTDGIFKILNVLPGKIIVQATSPMYLPYDSNEVELNPGDTMNIGDILLVPRNHPPIANTGPDQTVYVWIDGIAEVNLDGSGSYDEDGDELTYLWSWTIDGNDYEANGVKPSIELPVGQYFISLIVNDGIVDSEPNEVNITVIGPVEANLCIMPKVLNCKGFQPKITAMLRLPKGITKDQIDTNEPILLYPGEIEADWMWINRVFDNKCRAWGTTILASFDKDELMDAIPDKGQVELVVVGQLKTGQYFFGTDDIRVICPGNWPHHKPWWNYRWNRWHQRPFNCRH